jgi:hypothetical protein
VSIFADDGHGGVSQIAFGLTVNNVAPSVNAGADATITSGDTFSINASFTDPGTADTHTASVDFGPGAQPTPVDEMSGSGTVSATFTYFVPGSYTVTVCVSDDDEAAHCPSLVVQVNPLQVTIDIKPGATPNCINNDGHGVIPVAILGSATFDVTGVDATSVRLEGLAVRVVGRQGNLQASYADVNGDGLTDLVVQIADEDGVFDTGDGTATLTATLFNGTHIAGSDTICIVPPQ